MGWFVFSPGAEQSVELLYAIIAMYDTFFSHISENEGGGHIYTLK